jgi:hypothetical protein
VISDLVPAELRRRVRQRAGDRCEYCRIAQAGQEATFHVDHVLPRREDGPTTFDNLALACVSCSLRKGARVRAMDPASRGLADLFHPRRDRWGEHFLIALGMMLHGRTKIGRATVDALQMNRPLAVAIRREEAERGRYPRPSDSY